MAGEILESVERGIVQKLLRIASIYDAYRNRTEPWEGFYARFMAATNGLRDRDGNPVIYSEREIIKLTVGLLKGSSEVLLDSIRELESSESADESNLFRQLGELPLQAVDGTDLKGLFLLAAKFGENSRAFGSDSEDDPTESDEEIEDSENGLVG